MGEENVDEEGEVEEEEDEGEDGGETGRVRGDASCFLRDQRPMQLRPGNALEYVPPLSRKDLIVAALEAGHLTGQQQT